MISLPIKSPDANIKRAGVKPDTDDIQQQMEELIRIETNGVSLRLRVAGDRLWMDHFGQKLAATTNPTKSEQPAFPTYWDNPGGESAISVIQADGRLSLELRYHSHSCKSGPECSTEHVIKMMDPLYHVAVFLHFLAHPEEDVIETWTECRNEGANTLTINHLASGFLSLIGSAWHLTSFHGRWCAESLMEESVLGTGVREIGSRAGTRTSQAAQPAFFLSANGPASEEHGEIYAGALAWSGNWRMRFDQTTGGTLHVNAGYNPEMSRYPLPPGQSLSAPRLVLTYSAEGKGTASRNLHLWARRHCIRNGGRERRILLNSWEGAYFKFDEMLIKRMISDAAATGIELFVLDDGWFGRGRHARDHSRAGLGDWVVNTEKLPNGLQGLIDHSKLERIDFGIWVEPEMVNPSSDLYQQHPDWVISLPGRVQREQRNQLVLDLSNPQVCDHLYGVMDELLTNHPGISFVKWDCNRTISDPGSTFLDDGSQERLWIDYVHGYYRILQRLTEKHTAVTFQACGSGGGRTDYGSLRFHEEAWTSDNTDAVDRLYMQWSLNHIYPAIVTAAHVTEVPNHQNGRVTPIKFRFDVAMSGRLGFELRPERVPGDEIEYSRRALQGYKCIRHVVQFGNLHRLLSPFEKAVAAMQFCLSGKSGMRESVVFLYRIRAGSAHDKVQVRLKELIPATQYQIFEINPQSADVYTTGVHQKIFSGDELLCLGLEISLKVADCQSAVLHIVPLT